ncbi:MAG: hypothetical protein GY694_19210 [Gammaproteobacteria bacterium]|nr:hypothetical protein [Gammaproteobacteria bacterium]
MKAMLSFFFVLLFMLLSTIGHTKNTSDDVMDYCYKPSKPLFLSTKKYKSIFADDMKAYQRCRKGYIDMKARVAAMQKESEKNAEIMREQFASREK